MFAVANQLHWMQVFPRAITLYHKHASAAEDLASAIEELPKDGFLDLYRHEEDGLVSLFLNVGDWMSGDDIRTWKAALEPHCDHLEVAHESGRLSDPWVKIAFAPPRELPYAVKEAYSTAMRGLAQNAGYLPGGWADSLGGPTPLSGALAGGMIGAGLGYGTGWLGEQLLPRNWRRGKLRRSLALMGGMLGAAPGALMMADNLHKGRGWNNDALIGYPNTSESMNYSPVLETGEPNPTFDPNIPEVPLDYKAAASRTGFEFEAPGFGPAPVIPLDAFNATLFQDPRVSSQLNPAMQAAASGLLEAAYQSRGGGPRLISPADIARISAGMGSGYLSGAIVGKALGALMGAPEPVQDRLRQTGMWAGIVANLVPLAFGAR
jgi:hypothetical protein